jgi:hypothetical protein
VLNDRGERENGTATSPTAALIREASVDLFACSFDETFELCTLKNAGLRL